MCFKRASPTVKGVWWPGDHVKIDSDVTGLKMPKEVMDQVGIGGGGRDHFNAMLVGSGILLKADAKGPGGMAQWVKVLANQR